MSVLLYGCSSSVIDQKGTEAFMKASLDPWSAQFMHDHSIIHAKKVFYSKFHKTANFAISPIVNNWIQRRIKDNQSACGVVGCYC